MNCCRIAGSRRLSLRPQHLVKMGLLRAYENSSLRYRNAYRFVLPQHLSGETFSNDELGKAWFAAWGLTLVAGRLCGQPAVADVFRDFNGSET